MDSEVPFTNLLPEELMNMGVINLIVCAHDARDAAHRLTVPVSGGRIRQLSG